MPKEMISRPSTTGKTSYSGSLNVEKALVNNFIALQKVMTNLAVKLEDLSTKTGKLLELFEISAKAIAENDLSLDGGPSKKIVADMSGKLDRLLDQNKVLAKGVSLLHEIPEYPSKSQGIPHEPKEGLEIHKPKGSIPPEPEEVRGVAQKPKDFSKKSSTNKEEGEVDNDEENYQKSISAKAEKPDARQNQNFP